MGLSIFFMVNHSKEHWNDVEWILNYLRGTSDTSICYTSTDLQIKGFANSDFGGDNDGQNSTTRYTFTLVGGVVSWTSKLQIMVALSITKAEYMETNEPIKFQYG